MTKRPFPDPDRLANGTDRRHKAAARSGTALHDKHEMNDDGISPYIFSFTKGLSHGLNGLLKNTADFEVFREGTEQSDPKFFNAVMPHNGELHAHTFADFAKLDCPADRDAFFRKWESPTAGHAYVLQGPDPFAITMPPAPNAGSSEFAAEMAEVYAMALLRDKSVAHLMDTSLIEGLKTVKGDPLGENYKEDEAAGPDIQATVDDLNKLNWFKDKHSTNSRDTLSVELRKRRRNGHQQSIGTLFRGAGEDGWSTPFLSQFMVMGTGKCHDDAEVSTKARATGKIGYGAQIIDQRVRVAKPGVDYMTDWAEYIDIQNGLNKRPLVDEFEQDKTRFMTTLRDLATYVHDDQLYQAYLNAAIIMLGEKFAFDPGIPFHSNSSNKALSNNRNAFALFGGPHLLTLVTEVSSRALKAVRLQKFSVHRRLRPEAVGALFHTVCSGFDPQKGAGSGNAVAPYDEDINTTEGAARHKLQQRIEPYTHRRDSTGQVAGTEPGLAAILAAVKSSNGGKSWLLPMAFPEGSPMHPAYGAGHATVAGACVTLLKAFFAMSERDDPTTPIYVVNPGNKALVPSPVDGNELLTTTIPEGLTLEGELNKLMWNISNGRNVAGVHYYTDYIESALLGEAITIGILQDQMVSYDMGEAVSMTVPLLVPRVLPETLTHESPIKGKKVAAVSIAHDGTLHAAPATAGRVSAPSEAAPNV